MERILIFFILLVTFSFQAHGAGEPLAELSSRYERYHIKYYINDDLSHVETYDWALKVLKERAVRSAKQASIYYSTSIQNAEVLKAYTRKADGRRIDVPKSNYQLKVNKGKGESGPVFSDFTTLTVVFPEVEVGDTVVLSYRITQTEPMFPGHFSVANVFPREYAYDDVKIEIDAPAKLQAQYEGRKMKEKVLRKAGRKIIRWTYRNKRPLRSKRRNYSVYDIEKEAGYSYSTFRSYAEIASAYGARALPKAAVSKQVRKLATEIVGNEKGRREQARLLYNWVATNIGFAGNCIGVGAVVPHDIAFILDNRMGDCKDHATLLQALLAAQGIDSTQALVNSGSAYRLPKVPVAFAVNHVINYIPEFDLFVDATSATTPFGLLPFSVSDKPVLFVQDYREGVRTPAVPVGTDRQRMKTVININPDGSVKGDITVELEGMFAARARAGLRHMPREVEEELVNRVLKRQGYIGSGTLQKADPTELAAMYEYKVKLELKDFIRLPGAGAFEVRPLFSTEAPVQRFLRAALEPIETVDVACTSGYSAEEYRYKFPKGVEILAIPEDMSISNDFLSYTAVYRLEGSELTVKRVIDDRTPGNVCSPAIFRAYKEVAAKALQNVRSQVVYK